ncbi:MAG TPA: polyprenyl synthetase family protein [Candidatus Tyrphobacter sp.]
MIDELAEESALQELIERYFRTSFTTENPIITEAVRRMLAAGGKRLRPRLTLLAVQACGGDAASSLHLAAYLELIHIATLIHDDVVDNAATRRGVNATAVDFGNRVSVLAGDYLFAWIFKNVTAKYPPPIPHVLSATLAEICDGEVLQLRALGDLSTSRDVYVEIARKKTASLFASAAECGAITGGGEPGQIAALRRFGELYGIAFQMLDDVLDLTADSAALGKPVGNDLLERKMTIPLILALGRGDDNFRAAVRRLFAGEREAVAPIVEAIDRQGGLAATREQIASFVRDAKAALQPLAASEAKERLGSLADALLD